jgi:hypothetical protein
MELSQNKTVPHVVMANIANIFVNFTVGVSLGGWIGRLVSYFQKSTVEHELIGSFIFSDARFTTSFASPSTNEKFERFPDIFLR